MPSVQSTLTGSPPNVHARDREYLLAHVLRKPREWVIAHPEADLPPMVAARYRRLLRRLIGTRLTPTGISNLKFQIRGEPLPYLLGEAWFYDRPFTVNRHVLIPRPETEMLIELVLNRLNSTSNLHEINGRGNCGGSQLWPTIVDVGTGSGCIAVTLAAELPRAHIIATDVSPTALRVARTNARRHGVSDRIAFLRGNLLEPLKFILSEARAERRISRQQMKPATSGEAPSRMGEILQRSAPQDELVILANLPYLTTAEWRVLPRSIRDHEPREALDGGLDGLGNFRQLFMQLTQMQRQAPSSKLQAFLEIDPRRKRALTALIRKTLPEWRASWRRDLTGRYRVLSIEYSVC